VYVKGVTVVGDTNMRSGLGFKKRFEQTDDVCGRAAFKNLRMVSKEPSNIPTPYSQAPVANAVAILTVIHFMVIGSFNGFYAGTALTDIDIIALDEITVTNVTHGNSFAILERRIIRFTCIRFMIAAVVLILTH
jgi:hypothetical protein